MNNFQRLTLVIFLLFGKQYAYAQKGKFEAGLGANYNFNFNLITNVVNSGTFLAPHFYTEDRTNGFGGMDFNALAGYMISDNTQIGIEYRIYNLTQRLEDNLSLGDVYFKVNNRYSGFGPFLKHYWNESDRKLRIFSRHGLYLLHMNYNQKIYFSNQTDEIFTYDYEVLQNYRSFYTFTFIFSNALGLKYNLGKGFGLETYLDFNLGIRKQYTYSAIFHQINVQTGNKITSGVATGMNKGDKIGLGINFTYTF